MKKLLSVIFAGVILILCCVPVFAEGEIGTTPEPINNVKSAEIVYVPLKNRIVFGYGSPNLPDGIILKLVYNDGTEKIEKIVRKDNGYYAGDESVLGAFHTMNVRYGCQTEILFINEAVAVEYDYFVIPPILHMIISFLQGELFIIA